MPFGLHIHSNRSKQALNDSSSSSSSSSSAVDGPPNAPTSASSPKLAAAAAADDARAIQLNQQPHADTQPYVAAAAQSPTPESEQRAYQPSGDLPARAQSTRYPSASSDPPQPPLAHAVKSADDLSLDAYRIQQQQGRPTPAQALAPAVEQQKKSKSIFDRMRSARTPDQKSAAVPAQASSSYNNTTGLARRLSKRQDTPPVIRTAQNRHSFETQQHLDWQAAQNSRSHLPSPQERYEDEGLDPYLIRNPDQIDSPNTLQELGLQHTIRPVQSDSEPPQLYPPNEDERFHNPSSQPPPSSPIHYQQPEAFPQNYQPPPQSYYHQLLETHPNSVLGDNQSYQPNAETISQSSYDSPVEQREEQRPSSGQSNGPSATSGYAQPRQQEFPSRTTSIQGQTPRPLPQHTEMAPPSGASQQNRRAADPKQTLQTNLGAGESRDGPPPSYNQQFPRGPTSAPGSSPIPPSIGQLGPNYRGGPPQRDQFGPTGGGDQGRSTPPPAPGERDVNDAYKELLQKYKKVKGLYFEKTAQVEQLQNTLANQRLSQSRTSLDDSEYMTRFQRLDGATTNLSFNIRKDWRSVPSWLTPYVNQDALKIGKQEMTGVGRACITRFLVDEIFNKTFHPGLETELSTNLKSIEQNIRRFSPTLTSQEESDALTAKVVQWRLATLDGLRDVLGTPESEEYKKQFSQMATSNLTATLINFLGEPPPPGITDSAHMIVELAVSIACNLPLESRDISIMYPMPGDLLQPFIMKVEAGIPTLETPGPETSNDVDASSTGSGDKEETPSKESEKADAKAARKEKTKSTSGMLQAMMGGNSAGGVSKKPATPAAAETSIDGKSKMVIEDGVQRVRFAGFVGVEVRGRQILSKAPVWVVGAAVS